jgi:flavin-dependent dehydrogenase
VLLIDKSLFPRQKVCGGYIGPENRGLLSKYGVWDEMLSKGAQKVTHLFLSSSNGDCVHMPLGRDDSDHGLGLSRLCMDEIMVRKAKAQGVHVLEGTLVKGIVRKDSGIEVLLKNLRSQEETQISVLHVITATGAAHQKMASRDRLFGVSAMFDQCLGMESDVTMHFIHQGHAGINRFEEKLINVCYLIKEALFMDHHGDHESLWQMFLSSNPWMRKQLGSAQRISPWRSTFIDMNQPLSFHDHAGFHVGDAVGLIHPVAGGGISMALNSGVLLGSLLGRQDPKKVELQKTIQKYVFLWKKSYFIPRMVSRSIGSWAHDDRTARWIMKILRVHEGLIPQLFNIFHQPVLLKESV